MRRRGPLLLTAVAAVLLVAGATVWRARSSTNDDRPADVGVVRRVVDGDTIDVEIGGRRERVRLLGIDTPEVAHGDEPAECFGPEAAAFTTGLLPPGSEVRLVRDVVGRDDYGRLLAYVYRRADTMFVNEEIVATGHARPLTIAPNAAHADDFVRAARAAHAAGVGLWAACAG